MKLTIVLAVLIGIFVLACSSSETVPVEPTPNIDATVEAKVAQERAVDATVQASSTTEAVCKLTGGETVQSGWTGKDTGDNSCNSCFCTNGVLGCTKMACPAHTDTLVPTATPMPVRTPSPTPIPTPVPAPTQTPTPVVTVSIIDQLHNPDSIRGIKTQTRRDYLLTAIEHNLPGHQNVHYTVERIDRNGYVSDTSTMMNNSVGHGLSHGTVDYVEAEFRYSWVEDALFGPFEYRITSISAESAETWELLSWDIVNPQDNALFEFDGRFITNKTESQFSYAVVCSIDFDLGLIETIRSEIEWANNENDEAIFSKSMEDVNARQYWAMVMNYDFPEDLEERSTAWENLKLEREKIKDNDPELIRYPNAPDVSSYNRIESPRNGTVNGKTRIDLIPIEGETPCYLDGSSTLVSEEWRVSQ